MRVPLSTIICNLQLVNLQENETHIEQCFAITKYSYLYAHFVTFILFVLL